MASPDELVPVNVVLDLSWEVEQRAKNLSARLFSLDTEFLLGPIALPHSEGHYRAAYPEPRALPHISLYQAAYPQRNRGALIEAVNGIARRQTMLFEVTLRGFSVFWDTFVFWDAVKTAALTRLHRELLEVLNPLREGKLLPIHEQLLADESIPRGLRESIRRYGNPLCGDEERPHLTLTRLKEAAKTNVALEILRAELGTELSFPANFIAIGDVGPHGTCPVLLQSIPFGG